MLDILWNDLALWRGNCNISYQMLNIQIHKSHNIHYFCIFVRWEKKGLIGKFVSIAFFNTNKNKKIQIK